MDWNGFLEREILAQGVMSFGGIAEGTTLLVDCNGVAMLMYGPNMCYIISGAPALLTHSCV